MFVYLVVLEFLLSCQRAALKNQRRFLRIGPPNVASYVGSSSSTRGSSVRLSFSNGVSAPHLSLRTVARNDPLNVLPPDLVIVLATPPENRPNSAEIVPVDV